MEKSVDVGITSVHVPSARCHERLDPGGGVAKRTAATLDEIVELFRAPFREEGRTLQWPEPRPDAHGLQVVENGFADGAKLHVTEVVTGVEAVVIAGFRQEVPRFAGVMRIRWWLPIEVETTWDEAPRNLREAEVMRLIYRFPIDRKVRSHPDASVVPRRLRI